jgi:hypothetical protein
VTLDDAIAQYGEEALRPAARHTMWRQGDLSYLLHDGQLVARELILQARAAGHRAVVNTGRRWGKSRLFVVMAAERCLKQPGARIPYAAPTETQVQEFVLPHWRLLAEHAPPELRPVEKGGDWVFPNGSRVVISGCEDRRKADRLRGPSADDAYLDEAGFVSITDYVVRSVLGPQLWTTGGQLCVSSTPPESPDHPFVALLEEAQANGSYFHATTSSAPHMTPALLAKAIDDCGGVDSITWQREGLARIVVDPERTVLPELTEFETITVCEHQRPEYYLPHAIGDAGFVDLDVIAFGYHDFVHDLDVIEDELVMRHARSDTLDACVAQKERELWGSPVGPPPKVHRRRIDAQPKVRADMSREEWQAQDPADAVRHWNAVSRDGGRGGGRLPASANAARVRIKRGRVRISPKCKTIIAHSKFARWDSTRSDFERPENREHHYDGCAALLYFLRDLDRKQNPYPALPPGITEETHYIPPDLTKHQRAERLAKIFRRQGRR